MAKPARISLKRVLVFLAIIGGLWRLPSLLWNFFTVPCIYSIAFSPNGKLLAGGGGWLTPHDGDDLGGALWIWNVQTSAVNQKLTLPFGQLKVLRDVAFSQDGSQVTGWQGDGKEITWNVRTGQLVSVREPQPESAQFNRQNLFFFTPPGGGRLATRMEEPRFQATVKTAQKILSQYANEELLTISNQNHVLVSAKENSKTRRNTVIVREIPGGKALQMLPEPIDSVRPVLFSPNDKWLALQQHGGLTPSPLYLWDLQHRRLHQAQNNDVTATSSVAFSPNSEFVAEGGGYGDVAIWSVATGVRLRRWSVK